MLSALIPSWHSYPAMLLAEQLAHQRSVQSGPLVTYSYITISADYIFALSRLTGLGRRRIIKDFTLYLVPMNIGAQSLRGQPPHLATLVAAKIQISKSQIPNKFKIQISKFKTFPLLNPPPLWGGGRVGVFWILNFEFIWNLDFWILDFRAERSEARWRLPTVSPLFCFADTFGPQNCRTIKISPLLAEFSFRITSESSKFLLGSTPLKIQRLR